MGRSQRKREVEPTPLTGRGLEIHATAVRPRNLLHDMESEPGARAGAITSFESTEDALAILRANPGSVVDDAEADAVVCTLYPQSDVAVVPSVLDRVLEEIDERPANRLTVPHRLRELSRRELRLEADRMSRGALSQKGY